jgi:hypothetical protein
MKLIKIILMFFLTGCSTYPKERIEIVHDYIFYNGTKVCESHEGLHNIVSKTTLFDGEAKSYPCHKDIKFRCQDGSLHEFETGIGFCFISEMQLDETNRNVQYSD